MTDVILNGRNWPIEELLLNQGGIISNLSLVIEIPEIN